MSLSAEPQSLLVMIRCAHCHGRAARVELVAPGHDPEDLADRDEQLRAAFARSHDVARWRFTYEGICAGNGLGNDVSRARASVLCTGFEEPLDFDRVHAMGFYDDAGFCATCRVPYCFVHWGKPTHGYGFCPHGHGKSLDPHWSPDF